MDGEDENEGEPNAGEGTPGEAGGGQEWKRIRSTLGPKQCKTRWRVLMYSSRLERWHLLSPMSPTHERVVLTLPSEPCPWLRGDTDMS